VHIIVFSFENCASPTYKIISRLCIDSTECSIVSQAVPSISSQMQEGYQDVNNRPRIE